MACLWVCVVDVPSLSLSLSFSLTPTTLDSSPAAAARLEQVKQMRGQRQQNMAAATTSQAHGPRYEAEGATVLIMPLAPCPVGRRKTLWWANGCPQRSVR